MKKNFILGSAIIAILFAGVFTSCSDDSEGSAGGYEYVDLGLPSGTKWATCNIGTSDPRGYGEYFAWGETKGSRSSADVFDEDSYKYYEYRDGRYYYTKYNSNSNFGVVDNKNQLDASDDAATVNWGKKWKMPTETQMKELINNCTWTYIEGGYEVVGKNGNKIFMPVAGYRDRDYTVRAGKYGRYWTSNCEGGDACAIDIRATDWTADVYMDVFSRYQGLTIRPVLAK